MTGCPFWKPNAATDCGNLQKNGQSGCSLCSGIRKKKGVFLKLDSTTDICVQMYANQWG